MPARLRAFISSTMEDLGNERRAVAARLRALNIDPVNAEDVPPDGQSSWDLLEDEIKSCQLFVLLSGRSYGWVPDAGPGAGEGRSITHMEALAARRHGLIVLPFFMTLKPGEKEDSQTKARDDFRKEIADWDSGYFRKMFGWADELAEHVGVSVSAVLGQALRREFEARAAQASVQQARVEDAQRTDLHSIIARAPWISPRAVLMAGAGMSIAAGYPTAVTLTQTLLDKMNVAGRASEMLARHGFAVVAQSFEDKFDRETLVDQVSTTLFNTDAFGPTRAHMAAVRAFDTIVTTNFDLLFEAACTAQGLAFAVVTPADAAVAQRPERGPLIYKIDGSIERPDSLVLTARDVEKAGAHLFWESLQERLRGHPLIVVGHALREAAAKRVPEARLHASGAYVTPFLSDADTLLLGQYGLSGVRADADSFMIAYEQALANRTVA